VSTVYNHEHKPVYESKDPDAAILWMWRQIARDINQDAPIIGYYTNVAAVHTPVPVHKLTEDEIAALRKEGIV
jgi:hypothetical protein